jgi:hypothetical protein
MCKMSTGVAAFFVASLLGLACSNQSGLNPGGEPGGVGGAKGGQASGVAGGTIGVGGIVAGISGGTIVAGGVGAGGTSGAGGSGGNSPCLLVACPALTCVGGFQPNPEPCGCPICAPNPDAGMASDAGGPDSKPTCPLVACPALGCVGGIQPNPEPCGCPICAPNPQLDGGTLTDGGKTDAHTQDAASEAGGGLETAPPHDGSVSGDDAGPRSDGTVPSPDGPGAVIDTSTPDAAGCLPILSSDLHVSASPGSGTITGGNLTAVLCPGGASVYVESAGARYDTMPYFLMIEYTLDSTPAADFDFQSPPGATNGELSVMVGLNSASSGDYNSPAGQDCGALVFTYYLPVPAGVSCEGGTGPDCPPGCGAVCSGFGCSPCTPQPPSVSYMAQSSTDCMGNSQTPIGSWQLSLASVTAGDAGTGSGLTYFTPHGSFTATLVATDGSAASVTLSVTF